MLYSFRSASRCVRNSPVLPLYPPLTRQRRIDVEFVAILEECHQAIKILLRDRIILVVVALSTADCKSQPHGADSARAVEELFESDAVQLHTAFTAGNRISVKAGSYSLGNISFGEQVARHLLDGEAIKRHIRVVGVDHPFPITPGEGPREIVNASFTVGITYQVQPLAGPLLAIVRRGKQAVNKALIRSRPSIGEELLRLLGSGRDADQIEIDAAQERAPVRFRRWPDNLPASLARMKASIGFRFRVTGTITGGLVRRSGAKDQGTEAVDALAGQLAPASIHSLSTAISAPGSGGPFGGIRSLAFPLTIA